MHRSILCCFLSLLACRAHPAQEPPKPGAKDAPAKTVAELQAVFAKAGVQIDLAAKTVAMKARAGRPGDLLEYVLITRLGKSHEALIIVEAQPSILNAALLAIGLTPGTNVSYKEKDPLPSEEEVRNGVDWLIVTPPAGAQVWFTVAWNDAEGKRHEHVLDDLLMDLVTGEAVEGADWIYIGGRNAAPYRGEPEVFIADLEGNLVSNCYLEPANHLVTLRHAHARSDQNWWRTELCPEPDTELSVTIHAEKPKLVVAREERLAKEKAAGKKPKGPPSELPALPASSDNPPPPKREEGAPKKEPEKKGAGKDADKKDGAAHAPAEDDADPARGGDAARSSARG